MSHWHFLFAVKLCNHSYNNNIDNSLSEISTSSLSHAIHLYVVEEPFMADDLVISQQRYLCHCPSIYSQDTLILWSYHSSRTFFFLQYHERVLLSKGVSPDLPPPWKIKIYQIDMVKFPKLGFGLPPHGKQNYFLSESLCTAVLIRKKFTGLLG